MEVSANISQCVLVGKYLFCNAPPWPKIQLCDMFYVAKGIWAEIVYPYCALTQEHALGRFPLVWFGYCIQKSSASWEILFCPDKNKVVWKHIRVCLVCERECWTAFEGSKQA